MPNFNFGSNGRKWTNSILRSTCQIGKIGRINRRGEGTTSSRLSSHGNTMSTCLDFNWGSCVSNSRSSGVSQTGRSPS